MKRIAFIVAVAVFFSALVSAFSGFSTSASIFSNFSIFSTIIFPSTAVAEVEMEEQVEEELAEEPAEPETEITLTFPSTINESTLAETYIHSVMPHKMDGLLRASRPSGLSLTGPNGRLYRQLAFYIDAVADGEESSTAFSFSPSSVYEKTTYTAEELGVSYIKDENGFNPDAVAAMQAIRSQLNFRDVAACLMSDFPLQMYWFGKGYTTANCTISGTTEYMRFTGTVMFKMRVAEDYATKVVAEDGTVSYSAYEVDTRYGSSIQAAAENAEAILDKYNGLTDYEMLKGYRDEIRSLTSYNTPAGHGDYQFSYGNPWQLVWVFDGDPETTVVCEGYAKAFQYLVEEGKSTAEAISVGGYLNEVAADHAHMWNIVSMDGHNYLVDVTNDYNYGLFLAGADGSVNDGYSVGGLRYYYNRAYMVRTDEELELAAFSYNEWKAATTEAPSVMISSTTLYPGYQVAIRVESSNAALPVERVVLYAGEEEEIYAPTDGIVMVSFEEDKEISIAAVIDGITTPATNATTITLLPTPQTFSLPVGSRVEAEAFEGVNVELVKVNGSGSVLEPGAFDDEVVLAVDDVGDWFDSGYRFVVE